MAIIDLTRYIVASSGTWTHPEDDPLFQFKRADTMAPRAFAAALGQRLRRAHRPALDPRHRPGREHDAAARLYWTLGASSPRSRHRRSGGHCG